jgi:exonuclease VII large subunit
MMVQPNPSQNLSSEIARGIEDAAETLRWCKRHLQERGATDALRLIQLNLSYLSLALDWQMEGEVDKAASAMDRVWWQPHREQSSGSGR